MAKKMDPLLIEILTKFGEDVERAVWDCHGVWVAYHKAIERIAAKAGIVFDMPMIVEANTPGKAVSIAVRGTMSDRAEWSFGEASAANCKNSYYYAMAEKRAKDRVVLKLIGLHGLVYSEEESDDFKPGSAPVQNITQNVVEIAGKQKSSAQLKREVDWREVEKEVWDCQTPLQLDEVRKRYRERAVNEQWNAAFKASIKEILDKQEADIADWQEAQQARELSQHPIMAG